MAHGGTNFGFWNGANGNGGTSYQPTITSYDYDSPISESGSHGFHDNVDKFKEMARVLQNYVSTPTNDEPAFIPTRAYGNVTMTQRANLFENLNTLAGKSVTHSSLPVFSESVGCRYGLIMYSHKFKSDVASDSSIHLSGVKDRAQVFVNNVFQGLSYRVSPSNVTISNGASVGDVLQVLVENMGRINFSPGGMKDTRKGLTGNVTLNHEMILLDWNITCLPLDNYKDFDDMKWEDVTVNGRRSSSSGGPTFYRSSAIKFDGHSDTFLSSDTSWLSKGFAWVNGFNLGRYWPVQGPQKTLYVPAPRTVGNDRRLVLLELEAHSTNNNGGDDEFIVEFQDYPILNRNN